MYRPLVFFALFIAFLVSSGSYLYAQDRSATERRLRQVRQKMEKEESRLRSVRKRKSTLETVLHETQRELIRIEKERLEIENELIQIKGKIATIVETIDSANTKIDDQQRLLEKRVVAIYKMQRRLGTLDFLLSANSAADLLKRSSLMSRVTEHDNRRLRILAELIQEFREERTQLKELEVNKNEKLALMGELEAQLSKERLTKAALLEEIRVEETSKVASIGKLKRSAAKLEEVLASIMGGEEEVEPAVPVPPDVRPPPPDSKPTVIATPFTGPGLRPRKGKLELPLRGSLVRTFGKQRHEEFSDVLFVKGLEFSDNVGASVKSVARGKVVLNQVLPGYGNVVILDHGERYYTLYGLLASTLVKVGQVVPEGGVVGILGQQDARKRNFYFELRIKGKPVNPLAYFRNKPAKLASS